MSKICGKVMALGAAACVLLALGACDPARSLSNPELAVYLESYERWQATDVVSTFNDLEARRGDFECQGEVLRAKRAAWREEVGPVKLEETPEGKALDACLTRFRGIAGLKEGPLAGAVLQHWVGHTFLPEAQETLDAEIAGDQQRLGEKGCGGAQCKLLAVVGEIGVARIGQEVAVAYDDAVDACGRADFGGLGPWRLPVREELVAVRESGKVATDRDTATYWSQTRELDDRGGLQAYVLRIDLATAGTEQEPRLVPFDRDGVPTVAKVRCVFDLGPAPEASGPVVEMERALEQAGCRRGWSEKVRLRDGRIVTWTPLPAKGAAALRTACKELGWCGLQWRAPAGAELKALQADPWFADSVDGRCVASVPASEQ